jgi:hypothetical protein
MTTSAKDPTSTRSPRAVRLTLGGCLATIAAAVALTLSLSPISVARVNNAEETLLGATRHSVNACQSGEVLPRGTSAVRLHMFTFMGPRVAVGLFANGRRVAHGERGSGWTGGSVTVPVSPLPVTRRGLTLCFALDANGNETVQLNGEPVTGAPAARGSGGVLPGRLGVEDLRPASASWWSLILPVARRMGLGHAGPGTWSVLLVACLMLGVILTSMLAGLRDLR